MSKSLQDIFSPDRLRKRWVEELASENEQQCEKQSTSSDSAVCNVREEFEVMSRLIIDRFGIRWKEQVDFFIEKIRNKIDARFPLDLSATDSIADDQTLNPEANEQALDSEIVALIIKLEDFISTIERIS